MAERVVNIVGMGRSAQGLPDTGENWGINYAYKYGRMDKLFFMDGLDETIKDCDNNHMTFIKAIETYPDMQLISRNELAAVVFGEDGQAVQRNGKAAVIDPFPLEAAMNLAPGVYFTSTMAYVVAYAILEKVDRLRLYGFEVWSSSEANEYLYQRPCLDFWLAFAMGRGIKVECPWYMLHTSSNQQNLYGFTDPSQVKGRF